MPVQPSQLQHDCEITMRHPALQQEEFSSELSNAQAQASPLPLNSCIGPPGNCTGMAY